MKTQGKKKRTAKTEVPLHFTDHATRKKIKKHLRDIHDEITEEDIKKVKVPGKDLPPGESKDKKDAELPGAGKEGTPGLNAWNVLEE